MMKFLLLLTVVAAFGATGSHAGSAEDAAHHLFQLYDLDNDGTLSYSEAEKVRQDMGDPQKFLQTLEALANIDQSAHDAFIQHIETYFDDGSEFEKRLEWAAGVGGIQTEDQFKYVLGVTNIIPAATRPNRPNRADDRANRPNSGRAVAESKALLGIVGGILLMYMFL